VTTSADNLSLSAVTNVSVTDNRNAVLTNGVAGDGNTFSLSTTGNHTLNVSGSVASAGVGTQIDTINLSSANAALTADTTGSLNANHLVLSAGTGSFNATGNAALTGTNSIDVTAGTIDNANFGVNAALSTGILTITATTGAIG